MKVGRVRLVLVGIFLGEGADDLVLRQRFFEQFARGEPADRQGQHGAGKKNGVARGQDGQRIREVS